MSLDTPQTPRQVVEDLLLDSAERRRLRSVALTQYDIPADDVEDLLQEVAVELLSQRQYVHHPRAYLYAVFRARCSRYVNAQPVWNNTPPLPKDSASHGLERRVLLRQALRSISSSCRKLLAARYLHGESLKEAAATMTLAYSGITKTINRCLKRLRTCIT